MKRSGAIAVLATAIMWLAPSVASAGGANHVVQVSANAGNSTAIHADVQWAPFGGPAATSANIASASSSDCTGCRAVSVAFQAIILTGSPNVVTPANAAVAVNGNCTSCDSFAFAYQDVVTTAQSATLSPAGIAALQDIQDRANAIARSGEPDWQMDAELKSLAIEFKADVEQNLVLHGPATSTDQTDVQSAGS
ncbi:MAG: putative peptide zinc metalloprotease protein [Gaiellales bacterium]|nr:putative peptide zinc metalloprotease protein [Gaiellales bacterium]